MILGLIIGMIVGCALGVGLMALLSVNRHNEEKDNTICHLDDGNVYQAADEEKTFKKENEV